MPSAAPATRARPRPLTKRFTPPAKATPAAAVKVADEGIVRAIVSVTGVVDSVNDLIVPGAYAKTLTVRRPKVADYHSWERLTGRVLHIEEWMPGDPRLPKRTKDGKPWPAEAGALVATMQYNLDSEYAREAFARVKFYAESNEAEFSVGYRVPDAMARKRRDGVRVILQVDLFELSFVMFGAAPLTMALEVKSAGIYGGTAGAVTSGSLHPAERTDEDPDEDLPPTTADDATAVGADQPWDEEDDTMPHPTETKTAAHLVAEAKGGNAETLRDWYVSARSGIAWGTPGDFDRCVAIAGKHMSVEDAKGYCNLRHHEATGMYPATHAALEGKAFGEMPGSFEEVRDAISDAARDLLSVFLDDPCVSITATFPDRVIVSAWAEGGVEGSWEIPYTFDPGSRKASLGQPTKVQLQTVAIPDPTDSPDDVAAAETEAAETVPAVMPMLATLGQLATVAQLESKAGQAARTALLAVAATVKKLPPDAATEPDGDEDGADDDGDGDGVPAGPAQMMPANPHTPPAAAPAAPGSPAAPGGPGAPADEPASDTVVLDPDEHFDTLDSLRAKDLMGDDEDPDADTDTGAY